MNRFYSFERAYKLSVMSDIAYADEHEARSALFGRGYPHVDWFSENGTQAYVARRKGETVIAIRGTSDIDDLLTDADIRWQKSTFGGRVHRGFWAHALRIHHAVIQSLESSSGVVLLTGHSLGADAAAQIGLWLARWRDKEVSLPWRLAGIYLYGPAKLGDAKFVSAYDKLLGSITFPHRNNNDPVCWVPWRLGRYKHVARHNTRYFTHDGRVVVNPSLRQLLQDGRRGAASAICSVAVKAVRNLPQHHWRLGESLWWAFRQQLSRFDHSLSEYIRLTKAAAETEAAKGAEL